MPALIMMASWRNFGTSMIIFLAGLQAVPWMLHEAAAIDGANGVETVPLHHPSAAASGDPLRLASRR